jgi:hypothetical protein
MGRVVAIAIGIACASGCAGERDVADSARGAPPENQSAAADSADRNRLAAADTLSADTTETASPWPADTFDVRIDRWSFEEQPSKRGTLPICSDRAPVITGDSIGPLRAGLTRAQLLAVCPRLHYGWFYTDDQSWAPAAVVRLGPSVAIIEFDGTARSSTITRISAHGPGAATPDGVRAGSTLATARETLGEPRLVGAKCAVYVRWPDRPGLIARLVLPDETGWECSAMRALVEYGTLRRVPEGTTIGFLAQVAPGQRR